MNRGYKTKKGLVIPNPFMADNNNLLNNIPSEFFNYFGDVQ